MLDQQASLTFSGTKLPLAATVEIEGDEFSVNVPPLKLRGRIVELGGNPVLGDLRTRPGDHTISFGSRVSYRMKLIQQGAPWFIAELLHPKG